MMANKLIIIPYKQNHGKIIMQSQMNHMLTQKDAQFIINDTKVRADFGIGIRFAKWLGFTNEGLMKNYGFDDTDHYRFARIY